MTPVVAAVEPSSLSVDAAHPGITTEMFPELRDVRTVWGALRLPYAVLRLRRLVDRQGVDLIHSLHGSLAPATILLSRLTQRPHLCHIQFHYQNPAKYRKLWLHRADNVAAVAGTLLEAFLATCRPRRPRRAVVIPNGIDADAFVTLGQHVDVRRSYGIGAHAFVVGMVGSLDSRKDPQALIRAASRLAPGIPNLHLLFVGPFRDPHYEQATRALADELGVQQRCSFVGFQPNPSPFFRAMDVFALPSRGEAHPLVVLEAMAHARPVVATRVGDIPATVEDGFSGLVIEADDVEGLARTVAALAADPDRRLILGTRARQRVEREFSATQCLERIVGLYAEILDR